MSTDSEQRLLEEGTVINNKWEILNHIATGGKGEVYLARQRNLDRQVALKVMSKQFMQDLSDNKEELEAELERFRREVKVMASMRHPNVLPVYDFDQLELDGETLDFIAMEYVPGPTLKLTRPEEGFGQDEPAVREWLQRYFLPVLKGVEAIHDKGIVHRDLKPANVLIDEGVPKIADFGLAGGQHFDAVTRSHHIIGTMPYMPEEQFLDLALTDVRADVYALGKILFEAVTGKLTPENTKPFQTVSLDSPQSSFFKSLDRIIRHATAKDRSERTPSVRALHEDIATLLAKGLLRTTHLSRAKSSPGHHWLKIAGLAFGVFLLVVLGYLLWHHFFGHTEDGQLPVTHVTSQGGSPSAAPGIEGPPPEPTAYPLAPAVTQNMPVTIPAVPGQAPYPEQVAGLEGTTLHLVPGGLVDIPFDDPQSGKAERTAEVTPFYMDATQVTNHAYVDFLHRVVGLTIENKAVLYKGEIWLLLGEVLDGYEPILEQNGNLIVKPEAAANPVVRVTPLGAMAYARYYGRELPTMAQWWRAVRAGQAQGVSVLSSGRTIAAALAGSVPFHLSMNDMMSEPSWSAPQPDQATAPSQEAEYETPRFPVYDLPANGLGIHGLRRNINEWTSAINVDGRLEFHIHGGLGDLASRNSYLERQPWEAFSWVGFRTVLNTERGS